MKKLQIVKHPSSEPNATLIKMLEDLLELAKTGELEGGIFAGANINSETFTCWERGKATSALILGAVEIVKRDFMTIEVEPR